VLIARIVVAVVLAVLYLFSGGSKLLGRLDHNAERLGITKQRWRGIGALEVAAAVGLILGIWAAGLGTAASIGLVLLMIGAILARVRAGLGLRQGVLFDIVVLLIVLASVVVTALAL
jgi:hypothetical protein